MFLHSITNLSNKKINKHFDTNLGGTNDVKFSLYNFLDYNPIKIYNKLHVFYCMNRMILDITFKFNTGIKCSSFMTTFMHLGKSDKYLNTTKIICCTDPRFL
jgi:hypothetical protein